MKREFLGDSYDAVKRIWKDMLDGWAELYADQKFIPGDDLQNAFTRLTKIPILPATYRSKGQFAILNDPDTGIRLPGEINQSEGRSHISTKYIIKQLRQGARCVVTFDQSVYRNHPLKQDKQRQAKMAELSKQGFFSFYYVSHAPFLFVVKDKADLPALLQI